MDQLLSLPRMARKVGVTQRWLKQESDAGRLPHVNAEGRYLYSCKAITKAILLEAGSPQISLITDLIEEAQANDLNLRTGDDLERGK